MADPRFISDPFSPPAGFVLDQKPDAPAPPAGFHPVAPPPGFVLDAPPPDDPRQISDPFVTITPDPVTPSRPIDAGDKVVAGSGEHGFRGWLSDLESDIRNGTGNTVIGRALQKMGAQGINVGAQGNSTAGDTIASPVLGTIKAAKGAADALTPGKRWQGAKEIASGALQAGEIPLSFAAPEAGEAFASAAGEVADRVAPMAENLASKFSPAKVAAKTSSSILDTLDRVATDAGLEASNATSASGKVADLVSQLKAKAKAIYQPLDEASDGQYQRFQNEISDIQKYISRTTSRAEATQLKKDLVDAQTRFADVKQSIIDSGIADPSDIAKADKYWSQARALEQVGKKFRNAETLDGDLKATPAVLDNATKNIDVPKAGTLNRAVGPENADAIRQTVSANTKNVASATRNRRVVGNVAKLAVTGGAAASVLKILGGNDSK